MAIHWGISFLYHWNDTACWLDQGDLFQLIVAVFSVIWCVVVLCFISGRVFISGNYTHAH